MAMSPNALGALEQVKMGLLVLYGAGYFTENAWIKIDGLIHRGQYKFTQGPPNHLLDEPLMSFDDSNHEAKDDVDEQGAVDNPFKNFEKDAVLVSEEQIPSTVRFESAASTQSAAETPSEPYSKTSSDEGNIMLKPVELAEELSPDYNHIQFDQVRNSTAGLTEVDQKSRSTYVSVEDSNGETFSPERAKVPENFASSQHRQNLPHPYSEPESTNDISQAENAATMTTKTYTESSSTHIANPGGSNIALQFEVEPGDTIVAQTGAIKRSKVHVDISAGDWIKVIKHVSGITYLGENLRTKERGQFPISIFQDLPEVEKNYRLSEKKKTISPKTATLLRNTSLATSSSRNDLDKVEGMNAAEWDKDDASIATTAVRSSLRGLNRKDSGFVNSESQSQSSEPSQEEMMLAMMSEMMDKKLEKIRQAEGTATGSKRAPSKYQEAHGSWKEPLKPVTPKSNICWFWSTPNQECRYTADECRDLHSYSTTGDTLNLRMGKPTWGALADSLPPPPNEFGADLKGKKGICTFWANNGKCRYSAEKCKFLHEGVAGQGTSRWPMGRWGREDGKINEERGSEDIFSLAETKDGGRGRGDAGWIDGQASGWVDEGSPETDLEESRSEA